MKAKISLVILTKEPISQERIEAINLINKLEYYHIAGIFIEDAMHLPPKKFFLRTLKRIKSGHIYLPDFITSLFSYVTSTKGESKSFEEQIVNKRIPIIRVKNIESKNAIRKFKKINSDLGIIIGHRIIPEVVYRIPKRGMLNVHHGILPRYAGSHTTFWSLVEGRKEVGVTVHKVGKKVDSGDILYIKTIKVKHTNSVKLYDEVKAISPTATTEALKGLAKKTLHFHKQDMKERKNWKPPTFFERIQYKKYL